MALPPLRKVVFVPNIDTVRAHPSASSNRTMNSSEEENLEREKMTEKRPPLIAEIIRLQGTLAMWLSHGDSRKPAKVLPRDDLLNLIVDIVCPCPEAKDTSASICIASVHKLNEDTKADVFQHLIMRSSAVLRLYLKRRKCGCPDVKFAFDDELTRNALAPLAHMLKIKAVSDYPFNELIDYIRPPPAPDEDAGDHLCVRLTYTSAILMRLLLTAKDETKSEMAKVVMEDTDVTILLLKMGTKLLNGKKLQVGYVLAISTRTS